MTDSSNEKKPDAPRRVDFKLTAPHTHKSVECEPGDVINIREDQAERLKGKGQVVSK